MGSAETACRDAQATHGWNRVLARHSKECPCAAAHQHTPPCLSRIPSLACHVCRKPIAADWTPQSGHSVFTFVIVKTTTSVMERVEACKIPFTHLVTFCEDFESIRWWRRHDTRSERIV
jgi:hypothetical protein